MLWWNIRLKILRYFIRPHSGACQALYYWNPFSGTRLGWDWWFLWLAAIDRMPVVCHRMLMSPEELLSQIKYLNFLINWPLLRDFVSLCMAYAAFCAIGDSRFQAWLSQILSYICLFHCIDVVSLTFVADHFHLISFSMWSLPWFFLVYYVKCTLA